MCHGRPTGTGSTRSGTRGPCERWIVRTCTASASESRRRLRSSSWTSSRASAMRRCSHAVRAATPSRSVVAAWCSSWPTWRRSVSRRSPSARASTRAVSASVRVIELEQGGHAAAAQHVGPLVEAHVDVLPRVVRRRRDPRRRPAEEARQRGGVDPGRVRRPLDGLQQAQPLRRARRLEHAAVAADHGRHADRAERVAHRRGLAVGGHEDGDVAGVDAALADRRAVGCAARRSAPATTAARRCRRRRRRRCRRPSTTSRPDRAAASWRRARRRGATTRTRSAAARGLACSRGATWASPARTVRYRICGSPSAAPANSASYAARRSWSLRQLRSSVAVAAPRGRVEVGVHVGAAERVDRLLRVADQHERRGAVAERPLDDLPLRRVGVLELVDHHDGEPLAQPGARGRAADRVAQRGRQPRQEVVVREQPLAALAPLDLAAHGHGQPLAQAGDGRVGLGGGLDDGVRVERRRSRPIAPGVGERERRAPGGRTCAGTGRRRRRRRGRVTSSTNVTSSSTSPATPSPWSTRRQNPWVVSIVAASKSASARCRLARRRVSSAGVAGGEQREQLVVAAAADDRRARRRARPRRRRAARARGRAARWSRPGRTSRAAAPRAAGPAAT